MFYVAGSILGTFCTLVHLKSSLQGLGDSSFIKVLTYIHGNLSLDLQHLYKDLDMVICPCHLSAEEAETRGSLGFTGQLVLPDQ